MIGCPWRMQLVVGILRTLVMSLGSSGNLPFSQGRPLGDLCLLAKAHSLGSLLRRDIFLLKLKTPAHLKTSPHAARHVTNKIANRHILPLGHVLCMRRNSLSSLGHLKTCLYSSIAQTGKRVGRNSFCKPHNKRCRY